MCVSPLLPAVTEAGLQGRRGRRRLTVAACCSLDRDDTIQGTLCSPRYLLLCSLDAAPAPVGTRGAMKYNCTNDVLVETVDGSRASAPKEEHEVKTRGVLWRCLKIIIGTETNCRERENSAESRQFS